MKTKTPLNRVASRFRGVLYDVYFSVPTNLIEKRRQGCSRYIFQIKLKPSPRFHSPTALCLKILLFVLLVGDQIGLWNFLFPQYARRAYRSCNQRLLWQIPFRG